MDTHIFETAEPRASYEAGVQQAYEVYDQTTIGVECAWPAPEREVLLTLT
jgi:hypothetical protein